MNLCSDVNAWSCDYMPSWICIAPCTSVLHAGRRLPQCCDTAGGPQAWLLLCLECSLSLPSAKLHRESLAFAGSAAFAYALASDYLSALLTRR